MKPTQESRVLEVLTNAKGDYVSGQYFLHTMLLSQYHARIWALQKKGYPIEASDFTDSFGFKSYRLVEPKNEALKCDIGQAEKKEDTLSNGYNPNKPIFTL